MKHIYLNDNQNSIINKIPIKCIIIVILLLRCIDPLYSQIPGESITDFDGNIYKTVKIGSQIWMQENLKVMHFNNGDNIETSNPDTLDLSGFFEPKFQWIFKNDSSALTVSGRLYTWYVVTDNRKICPTGWHVPTDADFCILENYLEPGIDIYCNKVEHRGTNIGNMMKEATRGLWLDQQGQVENNSSGFSGLPGGIRVLIGNFYYPGLYAYFWTTNEFDATQAWVRRLYHNVGDIKRGYYFKGDAINVRCLKDN